MPDKYQRDVKKQIQKIISDGQNTTGRKSDPLIEQYISRFYRHTPLDFLKSASQTHLYAAAKGSFNFIAQRTNSSKPRKVRVFNPDSIKDGWVSSRTIVELNTNDSPFILDSISAELTRKGHRIYEVMHPILRLKRDKSGQISEFFEKETLEEIVESSMHFQISYIADEKELKTLERDIENTLQFVNLTVADWQEMSEKINEIITYLDADFIPYDRDHVNEVQDFLQWALDNNFIFLGFRKYRFDTKKICPKISYKDSDDLGIFRAQYNNKPQHEAKPLGIEALPESSLGEAVADSALMEITKSNRKSVVHRTVHMDYITIKIFNKSGVVTGEYRLLGLFTSAVYYQSAMTIPIIRRKIDAVVHRSGFKPDSHNGKALVTVLEGYPRDELLQISETDLFSSGMGIVELMERPTTKFFVRRDRFNRFVSCIVFITRDRFNTNIRHKVQYVLEKSYNGTVTDYYTQVTESPLARIHMLIKVDPESAADPALDDVEKQLIEVTTSWSSGLRECLIRSIGERDGENLYLNYVDAFPESYKDYYHFGGTFSDIVKMEKAVESNSLTLDLYQLDDDDEGDFQLKLFHPKTQVTLSNVLPILENLGFHAVDELTFFIEPRGKDDGVWAHHFRLKVSRSMLLKQSEYTISHFKHEFEEALYHIWHGDIENDALNKLILRAGMKWRDIILVRAYSKYILQVDFPYSRDYIASAVARHPVLTGLMVSLFHTMFDPNETKNREKTIQKIHTEINTKLATITNITEDRVIRQFVDTISATLRTNFYQRDTTNQLKTYLSFKLDSQKVPNLPLPRPHVEIFVYSYDVEGVHLRGGKVARGGLRWSDRFEDFRTEVLGLVKAQMVKNSVIVPVGSKGGFVVKHPIEGSRDDVVAQGQECYKTYLSGLLDITDNIVDGKVVRPKDVVSYDDEDPYLVVAADKGTATFSDIANGVARDYGFWLDDAFASGGSVGYDHKAMGITARGAWISVQRHFMEMGIDCQNEDFTAIGVGDMSGDVFGNGMLLSKHTKLVGAFNHRHIFIDPTPDAAKSWKERDRLFNLPRSGWTDYNKKLISKGGGIFDRSVKKIELTKEIKGLLGIENNSLSPDALIQAMLKADVELLWNGGIGTYAKAEIESHESVGDKANDALRVNANELGCSIIGEGGNLGFTQLARIEYSMEGGRINTDAIDNSAGVDCSDHEVNIKIALNKAVENEKISHKQRNNLLARMTDDVSAIVLRDNTLQTQAITIAQLQGHMIIEQKSRMIDAFEERGFLDRKIEYLPDADTLALRQTSKIGLKRPELSVLLAYAKMDAYEDLICSNLPDDAYFDSELQAYFPLEMQKKYNEEIQSHQLRREIITTGVANDIINRAGSTFFHRMKEDTGLKGCDVARAYMVTRDAYRLNELWQDIENLGTTIDAHVQTSLFLETRRLVERASSWFLRNSDHPLNAATLVADFAEGIKEISEGFDDIISPVVKAMRDARMKEYLNKNVPADIARRVANLEGMASACDIVHVSRTSALPLHDIGKIYYKIGVRLSLGWLRYSSKQLLSHSHWENLAVQTFTETFFDQQMRVTAVVIGLAEKKCNVEEVINKWCEVNAKNLSRFDLFINDLRRQEAIDHSMLTVAIQRGEGLFSS